MRYNFAEAAMLGNKKRLNLTSGITPDDPPKGKEKLLSEQSDDELFDKVEDNKKKGASSDGVSPVEKGGQGAVKEQESVSSSPATSTQPSQEATQPQNAKQSDTPAVPARGRTMEPRKADKVLTKEEYKRQQVLNRVKTDSAQSVWGQIYDQMQPEWDDKRAKKLQNIAKIQALGDALKLGFEGFYGSKGARIDERRPGDAQTLAYFNEMKSKYEAEKAALNKAMYDEAMDRLDHAQEMDKVLTQEQGLNQRKLWDKNTDLQITGMREAGANARNAKNDDTRRYQIDKDFESEFNKLERQKDWDKKNYHYLMESLKYKNGKNGYELHPITLYKDKPFISVTDRSGKESYIPVESYDKYYKEALGNAEMKAMYEAESGKRVTYDKDTGVASKDFKDYVSTKMNAYISDKVTSQGYTVEVGENGELYRIPYYGAEYYFQGQAIPTATGASSIKGAVPGSTSIFDTSTGGVTGSTTGGSGVEIPKGKTGSLYADDEEEN